VLPDFVGRLRMPIRRKLLIAFLTIVAMQVVLGVMALAVLGSANDRAEGLGQLERKVTAYHDLQIELTRQLYLGARAVSAPDAATLDTTLRQIRQSTYRLDRLEYVTRDEGAILGQIEAEYESFIAVMVEVIELVRAERRVEAQALQTGTAQPLATSLERLTNELVNRAEADVVSTIAENQADYSRSRMLILGFLAGGLVLAVGLGFAIGFSVVDPLRRVSLHLRGVGAGDLSHHVVVANRDELGDLARSINDMQDQLQALYCELQAANEHKSAFLASMSHELRTPLNAVIGFSDVLAAEMFGELNAKQADYVQDILGAGHHLLALINDILDIAKVEAGRMEVEFAPVSVAQTLENGVAMLNERAVRRGISLDLQVGPGVGIVEADERKFRQIVYNLLSNAVKFTDPGGRVTVSAAVMENEVSVMVEDTGIGIAPEDQARIFEEFEQAAHSSEGDGEGTGLGLAVARKLAELQGGRIRVESTPGEGSRFTFTLPVRAAAAPVAAPGMAQ
jgi:signal transduction histidine kinase